MEPTIGITHRNKMVKTGVNQQISMVTPTITVQMIEMMTKTNMSIPQVLVLMQIAAIRKSLFLMELTRKQLNICGTNWAGIRQETEELTLDFIMQEKDSQMLILSADGIQEMTLIHTSTDSDT